jgi:hypothetical protein
VSDKFMLRYLSMNLGIALRCDACGSRIPLCIERELPGGINPDVMVWSSDTGGALCGQCRAAIAALTGVLGAIIAGAPR